jgi:hypothetical protein
LQAQQVVGVLDFSLRDLEMTERDPHQITGLVVSGWTPDIALDILYDQDQISTCVGEVGLRIQAHNLDQVPIIGTSRKNVALEGRREELLVVAHHHGLNECQCLCHLPATSCRSSTRLGRLTSFGFISVFRVV